MKEISAFSELKPVHLSAELQVHPGLILVSLQPFLVTWQILAKILEH